MKNKIVSLIDMIKLSDNEELSESYIRYICGIELSRQYKHQEILDLKCLLNTISLPTKQCDGFLYPNILDVYKELGDNLKQYQTIKRKNIQGILNCSDVDTDIFIDYFVNNELIEKLDLEDCYFVLKDSIDGLVIVMDLAIRVCELTHKGKI